MIITSAKFIISLFKIFILKVFNYKIVFCNCSRIGGYYDLIWHKRTNQPNKFYFILFAPNQKIANKYFNKIIEEEFNIKYENYNYLIYRIIQKLKLSSQGILNIVPDNYSKLISIYSNKNNKNYNYQKNLLIDNYSYKSQKIKFNNLNLLDRFQLKKNNYIAFHARDNNYLNIIYPNKIWSQHDFRDSDINNYANAIKSLSLGEKFRGIRTGKFVKKTINDHVITDYSNMETYSEEGELFLIYNSKLFLCSDTGASIFAEYIKKPIVYVNWCFPLRVHRWSSNSLFIFKKIFSIKQKRFLSIKESFYLNPYDSNFNSYYKVYENTAEEIRDALTEQILRLDGKWKNSQEDSLLQEKFWKLFGDYDYSRESTFIGTSFLKKNKFLLE